MVVMLEKNAQGILVAHAAVKHLTGRYDKKLSTSPRALSGSSRTRERERESFQEMFGCAFGLASLLPVQFFQLYLKSKHICSEEIV